MRLYQEGATQTSTEKEFLVTQKVKVSIELFVTVQFVVRYLYVVRGTKNQIC